MWRPMFDNLGSSFLHPRKAVQSIGQSANLGGLLTTSFFFFLVLKGKQLSCGLPYLHQIRSVAQSCPTLCDPMNCSTPGLPDHHQLPEFTQTHVHRLGDAIQPSHPPLSPSPPAPNPSQHQSFPMSKLFA